MIADDLDQAIKAVCPIDGVCVALGRIDYRPEATAAQRAAAAAVLAGWDFSDTAQQARDDAKQPERTQLRQAAVQSLADNATYLAIATPTQAQVVAQVRALTQQTNRIIKRLVQLD